MDIKKQSELFAAAIAGPKMLAEYLAESAVTRLRSLAGPTDDSIERDLQLALACYQFSRGILQAALRDSQPANQQTPTPTPRLT